jgi:hypothetical protein
MESNKEISRDNEKELFMLTSLNYESWAPKAMKYLLAYPGPWEWIKTGMEPTFVTPPLEIPAEAPARCREEREPQLVKVEEQGEEGEREQDADSRVWPNRMMRRRGTKKGQS